MTLEEIEEGLPNGFHDSQITSLSMDYERACLRLRVKVLSGLPGQGAPERDSYRIGILTFEGVRLFVAEVPEPASSFQSPGSIWFSYEKPLVPFLAPDLVNALPRGTLVYSLFVLDWLSCIHVGATDVGFAWAGSEASTVSGT